MKTYYGKGPVRAKSYVMDDLLFVVMRDGMTRAEQTMLEADRENLVREFRQQFENEMGERLTGLVEQLTHRKVVNYQSQVLFDPDLIIEIFVFDRPLSQSTREASAAAVTDPEPDAGEVIGDDPDPPA
jgi:uncharacterized protein YbcI